MFLAKYGYLLKILNYGADGRMEIHFGCVPVNPDSYTKVESKSVLDNLLLLLLHVGTLVYMYLL